MGGSASYRSATSRSSDSLVLSDAKMLDSLPQQKPSLASCTDRVKPCTGLCGAPQGTTRQDTSGYERAQDYDTSTGLNRLSSRQGRPRLYAVRPHDGHERLSHRHAWSPCASLGA